MNNIRKCPHCNKVFFYIGKDICPYCNKSIIEAFNFLKDIFNMKEK